MKNSCDIKRYFLLHIALRSLNPNFRSESRAECLVYQIESILSVAQLNVTKITQHPGQRERDGHRLDDNNFGCNYPHYKCRGTNVAMLQQQHRSDLTLLHFANLLFRKSKNSGSFPTLIQFSK